MVSSVLRLVTLAQYTADHVETCTSICCQVDNLLLSFSI